MWKPEPDRYLASSLTYVGQGTQWFSWKPFEGQWNAAEHGVWKLTLMSP